jgi:lipoprotein-anchoring transpeptidase ErfK/SrfK
MRDTHDTGTGWRAAPARGAGHWPVAGAMLGVLALALTACSGPAAPTRAGVKQAPVSAVQLTITPADHSRNASPGKGATIVVSQGKIANVTMLRGRHPVNGRYNAARTAWHTTWPLQPGSRYTVTVTALDAHGRTTTRTSTFRTKRPSQTFQVQIFEGYHQTYGVGMPIILTFSQPVRQGRQAAVERSIQLWSSKPVVGAWFWDSSTSLVFRPRTYWPQHTQVRFHAHLNGLEIAPGVYGTADLTQSFRIGNSLIAVVNTASHKAKIYYRNKLFGVWPMSSGAPGDDTADGTYLTIEKANPVLMSGPGYHNFPVPYSVRFTWSGDYMHDAYWSVGQQGFANVSHGCVNLSPYHAQVYYRLAVPGDPITVTHSPAAGRWDDGWTEWFLTWQQFLRGSATHMAVQVGPQGSSLVSPATLPAAHVRPPLGTSRAHNSRAA